MSLFLGIGFFLVYILYINNLDAHLVNEICKLIEEAKLLGCVLTGQNKYLESLDAMVLGLEVD